MKKKIFDLTVAAEIGIFAAIGFVLDFFQGQILSGPFYNGGSIGIAGIVILIIGYRRGFLPALLTGLLMGILDLVDGFYSIAGSWYYAFLQVCLDYVISYAIVAVGIIFKNSYEKSNKISFLVLSGVLGLFCKFLAHFIAGITFWKITAPSGIPLLGMDIGNPYIYSFLYNGSYMFPSLILTTILFVVIVKKQPSIIKGDTL